MFVLFYYILGIINSFIILRKTKNLILTPHIGYVSEEAYEKFFNGYLKAIEAFIDKKPINQIS